MTRQSLRVLIVAQDRALIRQLSVFLEVAGYSPFSASSVPLALAALASVWPDVIIAEWDLALGEGRSLPRAVSRQNDLRHSYLMLLVEQRAARSSNFREMVHALEAGADDFLAKPLVYGEVLARLKAAVEAIQFEQSWSEAARLDATTGLPTRSVLLSRLHRELALCESDGESVSCAVLDLDFFRRVTCEHGRPAGEKALKQIAAHLKSTCGDSVLLARLGHNRFGCLLPHLTEAEATVWADEVRSSVADLPIALDDVSVSLTASLGVAAASPPQSPRSRGEGGGRDAAALLARATEALESAKISGRNVVVRDGEFDDEAKALTTSVPSSKLFHQAVARDVMTPCPVALEHNECVGEAAAVLRATGLSALPVVDGSGRVAGLIENDALGRQPALIESYASQPLGELMKDDCVRLPESTSFETLIDFLDRDRSIASIVIEQAGKPTGLVTRKGLRELARMNR